jgi:hypothetical protein
VDPLICEPALVQSLPLRKSKEVIFFTTAHYCTL